MPLVDRDAGSGKKHPTSHPHVLTGRAEGGSPVGGREEEVAEGEGKLLVRLVRLPEEEEERNDHVAVHDNPQEEDPGRRQTEKEEETTA